VLSVYELLKQFFSSIAICYVIQIAAFQALYAVSLQLVICSPQDLQDLTI